MTCRLKARQLFQAGFIALLMLAPIAASASHLDVSRLATELNLAAGQMAYDLRGSGAYSNLRQRADRLSREAADLIDAVRRNRSDSRVRSQFDDVSRRYASLEQAFLRLQGKQYDPYLATAFDHINGIYTRLSAEFYYDAVVINPRTFVYAPPVVIRHYSPEPDHRFQRGFVNPQRYQRESENRQEWRDYGRSGRLDYGRRQVQRLPDYDHRSPVLERQRQLDHRRPVPEPAQRGMRTETKRRNHYE